MASFTPPSDVAALTKVRAADLNTLSAAVAAMAAALPDETDIKRGVVDFGTDSGAVNSYLVTLVYPPSAYANGMAVSFNPAHTNTGASTINVNGLGVKSIRDPSGIALVAGLLVVGVPVELRYSAATGYFHMIGALSPVGPPGPPGGMTSVDVSGGTTGLTASGGPITSSGTITLAGTLSAANGGTGVANNSAATTTRVGAYALTETLTGVTSVTLPLTGTLSTLDGSETLTNKTVTAPTINGGTQTSATYVTPVITTPAVTGGTIAALTGFAIRNAGTGAFDMTQAHNGTLTAGRALTWNLNDAARSVSLTGNLTLTGNFTTSGAFASTFTMTNTTAVTFPVTGTLATLAGSETLTNKTLTTPGLNNSDITSVRVVGFNQEVDNGNSGTTKTVTMSAGMKQKLTLTGNVALTLDWTGALAGNYQLRVIQDGSGAHTVVYTAGLTSTRWLNTASAPAPNTTASSESLISMFYNGAGAAATCQSLSRIGAA